MTKAASLESWESQLSNAANLVARGTHHPKIQALLENALDLEGFGKIAWKSNVTFIFPKPVP